MCVCVEGPLLSPSAPFALTLPLRLHRDTETGLSGHTMPPASSWMARGRERPALKGQHTHTHTHRAMERAFWEVRAPEVPVSLGLPHSCRPSVPSRPPCRASNKGEGAHWFLCLLEQPLGVRCPSSVLSSPLYGWASVGLVVGQGGHRFGPPQRLWPLHTTAGMIASWRQGRRSWAPSVHSAAWLSQSPLQSPLPWTLQHTRTHGADSSLHPRTHKRWACPPGHAT